MELRNTEGEGGKLPAAAQNTTEVEGADNSTTELVPYKRGLPLGEVAKGTLARFLPGSVIGMGVLQLVDLPFMGPGGPLPLGSLLELLLLYESGPLLIGFGVGHVV